MSPVFPEIALMVSPRAAYAALVRGADEVSAVTALRRPLLVAVVIGVSVAIAGTGRVTPALALDTTIAWSYIVLLQLAIALPLVAPRAHRTVGVARALDLFFAGHAPWSLVPLVAAAWAPPPDRSMWPVYVVAIFALVTTPRIVTAFFLEVLGLDPRTARRMAILHQTITWTVFVVLFWIVNALSPRVLQLVGLT
jgi:hypothetical protein